MWTYGWTELLLRCSQTCRTRTWLARQRCCTLQSKESSVSVQLEVFILKTILNVYGRERGRNSFHVQALVSSLCVSPRLCFAYTLLRGGVRWGEMPPRQILRIFHIYATKVNYSTMFSCAPFQSWLLMFWDMKKILLSEPSHRQKCTT